jgi:hypothetical protein
VPAAYNQNKGDAMTEHSEDTNRDSKVDAWAIFFLILIVVSTAVFWVSHQ